MTVPDGSCYDARARPLVRPSLGTGRNQPRPRNHPAHLYGAIDGGRTGLAPRCAVAAIRPGYGRQPVNSRSRSGRPPRTDACGQDTIAVRLGGAGHGATDDRCVDPRTAASRRHRPHLAAALGGRRRRDPRRGRVARVGRGHDRLRTMPAAHRRDARDARGSRAAHVA